MKNRFDISLIIAFDRPNHGSTAPEPEAGGVEERTLFKLPAPVADVCARLGQFEFEHLPDEKEQGDFLSLLLRECGSPLSAVLTAADHVERAGIWEEGTGSVFALESDGQPCQQTVAAGECAITVSYHVCFALVESASVES